MLLFLPVVLLLIAALAILIWQAVRPGFGVPWLVAVFAGLTVWGSLLFLRFRLPLQVVFKHWLPLGEASDYPYFQLDPVSWIYAFALAGVVLAVLLTAPARPISRTIVRGWAGILSISAMAMLAILSANPLTMAVTWVAIDLIELVVMLATVHESEQSRQAVVAFASRIMGIFVLLWAVLVARAHGVTLTFTQVPPEAGVYLMIAAGLRLGVLPLHLPYMTEVRMRRGLGGILRLAAPASSLVLLARLPSGSIPSDWAPYLLALTALAVLYGAVKWLFATDELEGRPYWLISLASLAVACVIRGQPLASIAWGITMMLAGSLLFFYSARQRSVYFLPVLGLLALSGLPFTPAGAGWQGLWTLPFNGLNLLFILALAILLAGYLRHAFQPGEPLNTMERWVQTVYPFGLLMLLATDWVGAYLNLRGSFALGSAWVGVVSILLALGGVAVYARIPAEAVASEPAGSGWLAILTGRAGRVLSAIFRLNWLYRLIALVYGLLRRVVLALTAILEGEAGVLWVLVLLALLISLLTTGGRQ